MAKRSQATPKATTRAKTRKDAADSLLSARDAAETPSASWSRELLDLREILGQDRAVKVMADAIASRRVHHAWILHGPAGVGKCTAAVAFAALLLDPTTRMDPDGLPRCDEHSNVRGLLRAGTHPDFRMIVKELARFSDDPEIRDRKLLTIPKQVIEEHLVQPAALAPLLPDSASALARKVFIVDEAELLDRSPANAPVQNSILKTVEEPPTGTVIMLVTTHPDRLLPTIRSRAQQVGFGPLSDAAMQTWLQRVRPNMDPAIAEDDLGFLQSFAGGSPGELLRAHRSGLAEWARTLEPLLAASDSGRYSAELAPSMVRMIESYAEQAVSGSKQASKEAANRDAARQILRILGDRLRRKLRSRPEDSTRVLAAIDRLREAERHLESSVQPGFVLEWLAGRLAATSP